MGLWMAALIGAASILRAETTVHLDTERGRVEQPGEVIRAHVLTFSGRPLKVDWELGEDAVSAGKPVALEISRLTGARRIVLDTQSLAIDGKSKRIEWNWPVPPSKGTVHYEVRLNLPKLVVMDIEARDEKQYLDSLKILSSGKLESSGLTAEESAALVSLGLRIVKGAAGGDQAASLMFRQGSEGGSVSQTLVFSKDQEDVLWFQGSPSGGWRVRVPRTWISGRVLSTDEGRLRLISLLCETPTQP